MNVGLECRRTSIEGHDVNGNVKCAYHGRSQVEIQCDVGIPAVDAIRVNGEIYVKLECRDLKKWLDEEWASGKPAIDVRPAQMAELKRLDSSVVGFF